MDASSSELKIGKRASVPKHGKSPENRLWSRWKRGDGKTKERDETSINPDAALDVVAVCGTEARVYSDAKHGRRLLIVRQFSNHGQALSFADEYEEYQRRPVQVQRIQRAA